MEYRLLNNGIECVQKRPHLFLRNGVFLPEEICGHLLHQAFVLEAKKVEVQHYGAWWGLASDVDWLTQNANLSDPKLAFTQIMTDKRFEPNSHFTELILSAFCSSVLAYAQGNLIFKIGEEHRVPNELREYTTKNLCILFEYIPNS